MVNVAVMPAPQKGAQNTGKEAGKSTGLENGITSEKTAGNEKSRGGKFAEILSEMAGNSSPKKLDLKILLKKLEDLVRKVTGNNSLEKLTKSIKNRLTEILSANSLSDKEKLTALKGFVKDLLKELKESGKEEEADDLLKLLSDLALFPEGAIAADLPEAITGNESRELSPFRQAIEQEAEMPARIVVVDLRKPQAKEKGVKNESLRNGQKEEANTVKTPRRGGEEVSEIRNEEAAKGDKVVKYYSTYTINPQSSEESGFQETLTKHFKGLNPQDVTRLKSTLNNEVVKNTNILLKNSDKGEIRLILKPESLGRVRIQVNLNNNNIEGRIYVENNIVRELFESSMNNLNNALKGEGFNSISLQVSVGGDQSGGERQTREDEQYFKEGTEEFEKNIPLLGSYENGDSLVNLVI